MATDPPAGRVFEWDDVLAACACCALGLHLPSKDEPPVPRV